MARTKHPDISVGNFISHYQLTRPVDWSLQFDLDQPLDVEIGFGLGEFLVRTAELSRNRNFVGIEQDWKRVKKTLRCVEMLRSTQGESDLSNLRVLQIDALVALERLFYPQSIHRIFCLFPCPWPKKSHTKHRLFSHQFFRLINNRLCDGGEVQIVTDYWPFFVWIMEEGDFTGFRRKTQIVQPQFNTKFERKWCEEGRSEFYELFMIKEQHIDVPVQEDCDLKAYFVDRFDPERFQFSDITGELSIIFKEFVYDSKRHKGMLRVVVAEQTITQQVWIVIVKCEKGWCIAKAEGHTVLPTRGVAHALRHVYEQLAAI